MIKNYDLYSHLSEAGQSLQNNLQARQARE